MSDATLRERINSSAAEARKDAILRKVWYLVEQERETLSRHFLLRCDGLRLVENVFQDTENECKDTLEISDRDGKEDYEVEYCGCTFESINNEDELLLSCRGYMSIIHKKEVKIVLVQRRWRTMSQFKYDETKEYIASSTVRK